MAFFRGDKLLYLGEKLRPHGRFFHLTLEQSELEDCRYRIALGDFLHICDSRVKQGVGLVERLTG